MFLNVIIPFINFIVTMIIISLLMISIHLLPLLITDIFDRNEEGYAADHIIVRRHSLSFIISKRKFTVARK